MEKRIYLKTFYEYGGVIQAGQLLGHISAGDTVNYCCPDPLKPDHSIVEREGIERSVHDMGLGIYVELQVAPLPKFAYRALKDSGFAFERL